MPRQPLGQISGNSNYRGGIEGRFGLTPNWHSHVVGRAAGGQAMKVISQDLNIAPSTIQNTIDQAVSCFDNKSLHQSSHPNMSLILSIIVFFMKYMSISRFTIEISD